MCGGTRHKGIPNRDSGGNDNHDCSDRERERVDVDGCRQKNRSYQADL